MPRVIVESPAGLFHRASGFWAQGPGTYEFPDDPRFAGFLQGHIERGTCRLAPPPDVPDDLGALKIDELKALAKERGVEFKVGMSKADLIAALSETE